MTGEDEIVIQGDVSDDVIDFILDKWPQVSPHNVMYLDVLIVGVWPLTCIGFDF